MKIKHLIKQLQEVEDQNLEILISDEGNESEDFVKCVIL